MQAEGSIASQHQAEEFASPAWSLTMATHSHMHYLVYIHVHFPVSHKAYFTEVPGAEISRGQH
jgi:hypothetical protein